MTKTCSLCGMTKPRAYFSARVESTDGLRGECRECAGERKRAWLAAHPGKSTHYHQTYCAKHPEKVKRMQAESNAKQRQKFKDEFGCTPHRIYKYGTSGANELAQQGGTCAICGRPLELSGRGTHVDHCHASGLTRGVLCRECNLMLGFAKDRPWVLRAAAEYLESTGIFS